MKKLVLALAVLAAVAAPAAGAGGWATAGLSSLPPSGLGADEEWPVDVTVLQHGDTPLAGVTPLIRIRDDQRQVVETFTAAPTDEVGVYRAVVRFPSEGTYSYEVYDGFETYGGARTHTFAPVEIGAPAGGVRVPVLIAALALALGLAAATILLLRRRHAQPAPVATLKEAT
jgi:hypothetical protein